MLQRNRAWAPNRQHWQVLSESLIAIFSNTPLLWTFISEIIWQKNYFLFVWHTLGLSVYWHELGHLWTLRDLNPGMATRGLCHWPNKRMSTVYFQSALLYCGSNSTSVSPPDVLQDGLHRAQISLQYSASVLSCLRTYPWFIFHLRSITEIAEEVVGWVREFKWRPMSHSEFAGFQRVWRRKKKQSASDCCLTGPVRLRDSRFMWQWRAPSPAGDAGRFGFNSGI